jgi:hypothetical protein
LQEEANSISDDLGKPLGDLIFTQNNQD